MAVGVWEVHSLSTIVVIDFVRTAARRVCPVLELAFADAAKHGIEIRLADQEGIVLWPDRTVGIGEIERNSVVEFHHVKMTEAGRRLSPQHLS